MVVSEQIIQVLDNLCMKLGLAIDWTSENVMPYLTVLCTKLVSYEIWTSVAWIVILFIAFLMSFLAIKKFRCTYKNDDGFDYEFWSTGVYLFALIFGVIGIFSLIEQIMDIIKCLTFPELFIFQYIQALID